MSTPYESEVSVVPVEATVQGDSNRPFRHVYKFRGSRRMRPRHYLDTASTESLHPFILEPQSIPDMRDRAVGMVAISREYADSQPARITDSLDKPKVEENLFISTVGFVALLSMIGETNNRPVVRQTQARYFEAHKTRQRKDRHSETGVRKVESRNRKGLIKDLILAKGSMEGAINDYIDLNCNYSPDTQYQGVREYIYDAVSTVYDGQVLDNLGPEFETILKTYSGMLAEKKVHDALVDGGLECQRPTPAQDMSSLDLHVRTQRWKSNPHAATWLQVKSSSNPDMPREVRVSGSRPQVQVYVPMYGGNKFALLPDQAQHLVNEIRTRLS